MANSGAVNMCGVFGVLRTSGADAPDERRFISALGRLAHRGPDARQHRIVDDRIALGHARLSIIDLDERSHQPMVFRDRYWIVYNGEVFNYLELRQELEALGHRFMTEGDTEVVLHAYHEWGEDCVKRFNGMWAIAIYDRESRTLFCSRDRFGQKPFCYAVVGGEFLFASEIKALLKYAPELAEPAYDVIANFCRTSVGAQHPETWFKRVRRLQPGCNLTVDAMGEVRTSRYWEYPEGPSSDLDFEQATAQYKSLFQDAVAIRMRSDVPLGVTLSSGVDSSSIACVMQSLDPSPHHSFTARFRDDEELVQDASIYQDSSRRIDESVVATALSKRLNLQQHVIDTDYRDLVPQLTRIIYHLESGNSSPAVIPLMQLLERAREDLTVVMDGQGADELLAGYITSVIGPAQQDLLRSRRFMEAWRGLREYLKTYTVRAGLLLAVRHASNNLPWLTAVQQRVQGLSAIYGPKLRGHPPKKDFPDSERGAKEGALTRRLREQHSGGLVNLLHYGDAISMANSLEARMPFLDHRLVEFVWALPGPFKVRMGVGKYIHREAMRGLVDDGILDERAKYGFTTPIDRQFRKIYAPGQGPLDVLLSERCLSRGLFDRKGLKRLISRHRSERANHGPLLFRLLSVELWFRVFIDGEMEKAS